MDKSTHVHIKLIFISVLSCILLSSCEQNQLKYDAAGNAYREVYSTTTGITERIEYYPNGKVKVKGLFKEGKKHGEFFQYHENGKLEATVVYRNDVLDGVSKIFYPNGKLKRETCFSKGLPVGWSYEYWENGGKKISRHFIKFEGGSKRNQFIVYNNAGVAINDSSHYMTITSRNDTINLGEKLTFYFKLEAPFYGSKSQVRLLLGGFDDQYRLVNPAKTDTIVGDEFTAKVTTIPKRRGKHIVRGRLDDYKIEPISADELMDNFKIEPVSANEPIYKTEEVYIYFTKSYYVK